MSKGASKTLIGGFVVGAVALLLVAVLIFGSGEFFSKKVKLVLFFEESISGLNLGAPVVFRGVTIGSVVAVELWNYPQENKVLIPVYVEIDPKRFKEQGDHGQPDFTFKTQIEKGLRAQIKMQSLLTGQLMIYVDYFPGKPLRLVKAETRYPEIPTIPSGTEQIIKALAQIPVHEIAQKATLALEGIERVINSPETGELAKNLNATLKELRQVSGDIRSLARNLDAQINPLAAETKGALGEARNLLKNADKEIIPLAAGLKKTLDQTEGVLVETRQALKKASDILSDESVLSAEFIGTMEEISKTMRSIQLLADFLKRHPESLLRGKSPDGGH
ncbi:MAG: MCE family protein [Deltaproteobacteria bacterium]|nr:MCE family protein [Deltaproteobacteria bacterium]